MTRNEGPCLAPPRSKYSSPSRDFLTGFHKRKLAKADAARKRAQERDKQLQAEARREVSPPRSLFPVIGLIPSAATPRPPRKSHRERHQDRGRICRRLWCVCFTLHPSCCKFTQTGSHNEEEEEWPGVTPTTSKQRDEEYEDEEVLATVTVVEDFDPDTILHGPPRPTSPTSKAVPPPPISKPTPPKKPKAQKIRYQTKGARTADRRKQLVRKNEKAERAGGKASRERSSKNTRKSRK